MWISTVHRNGKIINLEAFKYVYIEEHGIKSIGTPVQFLVTAIDSEDYTECLYKCSGLEEAKDFLNNLLKKLNEQLSIPKTQ